MTNEIVFGTQIVSSVLYLSSVLLVYHLLVKQKDATIEHLKNQLDEIKNKSPDILVERLTKRERALVKEIEKIQKDDNQSRQQIELIKNEHAKLTSQLQEEHAKLTAQLQELDESFESMKDIAFDFFCPDCNSPVVNQGSASEVVAYGDREVDFDHEWSEFACGYSLKDGEVQNQCRIKNKKA